MLLNCRQLCKQRSSVLDLPKQHFGPSVMCSYCGTLWSKSQPQTRIVPGKSTSKSVEKMIKSCSENNKISRFKATLIKKSLKNKMNRTIIKCSVCSKNTEISCPKPKRLKTLKETTKGSDITISQKKRKRRVKDKTAGLNISGIKVSDSKKEKEIKSIQSTPIMIKVKKPNKKEATPIQKVRKLNLNKLNNALNDMKGQKPKNSLNNFLKELY